MSSSRLPPPKNSAPCKESVSGPLRFPHDSGRGRARPLLQGALRGAYADFLARDRHPLAALYVELDAGLVDRSFSVHINVAARQLAEGTFVERVLATVRQMELSPHQLTFDFDEDTLMDQQPGSMRSLQALRRFGVQLALDSFGTGISSLTALRSCEADVLKLDGTVARMLGTSGDDDPIVRAIIQLAHALDMQVVAEWVTSADQLRRLRVLGCDLVQGHLLGEPTAADLFASRVSR